MMARPIVIIAIEGVGDADGLWKFCSDLPSYARADSASSYKPWMPANVIPRLVPQGVPVLGGVVTQGELAFELVDILDAMTAQFATERPSMTFVYDDAISDTDTSITFGRQPSYIAVDPSALIGTVVCIGRECIRIDGWVSGNTWTVTRGWLGTQAQNHVYGDLVYPGLRYLAGREVTAWLLWDAPGIASESDEAEQGRYWLDLPEMAEDLNSYVLRARSRDRVLDGRVFATRIEDTLAVGEVAGLGELGVAGSDTAFKPHVGGAFFVSKGQSEIVRCEMGDVNAIAKARGSNGTAVAFESSGKVSQVFVSDIEDAFSSFRYQPPDDEGTDALDNPSWVRTQHPVPIILALALSGGGARTNYVAGEGNFDCLPEGIGLGLDASEIDWDAAWDAWRKTQTFEVPYVAIDSDSVLRDVIDRLAKLAGYVVGWRDGKLAIRHERPETATTVIDLTASDIVTEETAPMMRQLKLGRPRWTTEFLASEVVFTTRDRLGTKLEVRFREADFPTVFGASSGVYGDTYAIEIDASWMRVEKIGDEPESMRSRALELLLTFRRPLLEAQPVLPLEFESSVKAGSFLRIAYSQIPDMSTGQRGTLLTEWLVTSVEPDVEAGELLVKCVTNPSGLGTGRITASGRIASASGADVTLTTNRYSDPASTHLPASDAACFEAGMSVVIRDRAGVLVATSPTTNTVLSVAGDVVTLASNWSAYATSGRVLESADYGDASLAQKTYDAFMADGISQRIDASGEAFRFGRLQ